MTGERGGQAKAMEGILGPATAAAAGAVVGAGAAVAVVMDLLGAAGRRADRTTAPRGKRITSRDVRLLTIVSVRGKAWEVDLDKVARSNAVGLESSGSTEGVVCLHLSAGAAGAG